MKLVGGVLKVDKQSAFTKFDFESSTELLEVELWLDNVNGVFMAERRTAFRYALFLAMSWLYTPMVKRRKPK